MDWQGIIVEPAKVIVEKAWLFFGKLVVVLVILVVGWVIAKALLKVVTRFLKVVQLDVAADKSGISGILEKGEIKYSLSELIGILVYWLVMLIVFVAAINALNLTVAAQLLDKIVGYVPSVIAAIFVLVLGMFIASIVSTVVNATAINAGITQAKLLSRLTQTIIIVIAAIMSLEQLKIATTIINLIIPIVLGAFGLALALSFGLGAKDIAGKAVKDFVDKLKK